MTDEEAQQDLDPRQRLFALEGIIRSYVGMNALEDDGAYLILIDHILESTEDYYPFVEIELRKRAFEEEIEEKELTPEALKHAYRKYGKYLETVAGPLTPAEEEYISLRKDEQRRKSLGVFMRQGFSQEEANQKAKEVIGRFPYETLCKLASATALALKHGVSG